MLLGAAMIGKTISHYRVLSKLGEGGMGVVYKAEDLKLQRFVALKFLPQGLADETNKSRFIHEARAASALEHPNICSIFEIDETPDGRMFIVMPCYEGESLEARITRGPLPIDEALEIARQVASGLARAHEKGIIHRDIKPANLFLTQDGPKIVDFGLAKLARQTKLTRTGTTVGTVRYMSPEQARGEETDHRSDLWSLGVALYEMVTGKLPFKGDHEPALLYSITNQDPELVSSLRKDAPPEMDDLVERMLAKKPGERVQSADEVVTELTALKEELSVPTGTGKRRRSKAAQRRARKRWAIRLGIPATVGILVLAYFFLRPVFFQDIAVSTPAPIAVVAFENQTGDPSLDYLQDAIPNLLITSLEQSSYLQVATWERLRDLLKQMGKEDIREIDEETASELCRLGGYCAVVRGTFTKAGDVFVTNVKVIDAQTKQSLGSAKTDGKGPESILTSQIDELSKDIARTTGLSERKFEETTRPIMEVTTTSLQAYGYFLKGREADERQDLSDAMQLLEKAVEIDSTFAIAYLYLTNVYFATRGPKQSGDAWKHAKRFSEKATEKERLYIEAASQKGWYEKDKQNRVKNRVDALKELILKYPNEKRALAELGSVYATIGMATEAILTYQRALSLDPTFGPSLYGLGYAYLALNECDKAIQQFEHYASLNPLDANPFDCLGDAYFKQGNLDDAISSYGEAVRLQPDFVSGEKLAYAYALKENYGEVLRRISELIKATPDEVAQNWNSLWKGFYETWRGNTSEAISCLTEAKKFLKSKDSKLREAYVTLMLAYAYYERGDLQQSARSANEARIIFTENRNLFEGADGPNKGKEPPFWAVYRHIVLDLGELREGRVEAAKERIKSMKSCSTETDTSVPASIVGSGHLAYAVNLMEAEVLLAEGSFDDAIRVGKEKPAIFAWDLNITTCFQFNFPMQRDVVARAYQAKGDVEKAIVEYERLVTFEPNLDDRALIRPIYHYRLAKLYEQRGRAKEALAQYRKFLTIMSEADIYLTEIADAKERVARLKI